MKKPFTVIGFYADNFQIFCHHVMADDNSNAFAVASADHSDVELQFVVALPGHQFEGDDTLGFPGECLVNSDTVLEQPDVFGTSAGRDTPEVAQLLQDFEAVLVERAGGGPSEANYDPELLTTGMQVLDLLRKRTD